MTTSEMVEESEKCSLCDEPFFEDDLVIKLESLIFSEEGSETKEGPIMYCAGCFMDIVNVSSMPIKRSNILEGNLERETEERNVIKTDDF